MKTPPAAASVSVEVTPFWKSIQFDYSLEACLHSSTVILGCVQVKDL